jgi:Phage integrase, N-terminal SAM-like domain
MLPWQPGKFNTTKDEATGRWVARARYRDGAGKSVPIKRQGRTAGGAEQAVRAAVRAAEKNWGAASSTSPLTVARLAAEWLDVIRPASVIIDPQTQSGSTPNAGLRMQSWLQYQQKLTTHVVPVLGDIPVETLRTPQCQRAIHALYDVEAGTGFRTAALTKQVLQQLLDYAVQQGYRTDNPVRSISKIPRKRAKPEYFRPRCPARQGQHQRPPGLRGRAAEDAGPDGPGLLGEHP